MASFRVELSGQPEVHINAARMVGDGEKIRFERRVGEHWYVERAFPLGTVTRIMQRFVEHGGAVRWAVVGRGLTGAAPRWTAPAAGRAEIVPAPDEPSALPRLRGE
jgi:hypothetical protein